MKFGEFRRWLKVQGVTFEAGKGSHFKVTAPNGNKTTFADHGSKEIQNRPARRSSSNWALKPPSPVTAGLSPIRSDHVRLRNSI